MLYDDLISRSAAMESLQEIKKANLRCGTSLAADEDTIELWIDALPPVRITEVLGIWVPCSKMLPESGKYVLVSYECEHGVFGRPDVGISCQHDSVWDSGRTVVAWMDLPKPYQEEK